MVVSCNTKPDLKIDFKSKSISIVGEKEYKKVLCAILDTAYQWKKYKIFGSLDSTYSTSCIDSLLCFNKEKNKVVFANLYKSLAKDAVADGLFYFYGVKINNQWYFFRGAYVHLPRNMYQKDVHNPLSFAKLHEIALKEIFGGYLTKDGEINEQFFKDNFEDTGWGVTSGKKEDFEKAYLQKVANNWYSEKKDTANKVLP